MTHLAMCFSCNNFETVMFASVVERDVNELHLQ